MQLVLASATIEEATTEFMRDIGASVVDLGKDAENRLPVRNVISGRYLISRDTKPYDRCRFAFLNILDAMELYTKEQPRNWMVFFHTAFDYPIFKDIVMEEI